MDKIKDIFLKDGEMVLRAGLAAAITALAGYAAHITAGNVFDAHEWVAALTASATAGTVAVRHQIGRLSASNASNASARKSPSRASR